MGDWRTVSVNGNDMRCYVAVPSGAGPSPVMAVLHGGFGFDAVTENTVDRLAAEGIAAIGPDLFHRGQPERKEGGGPASASMRAADFMADVSGALDFMSALPEIDEQRTGVMGFCMGGQVTYNAAGNLPTLKAAVAFYPGFVFERLGSGQDPAPFDSTADIKCAIMVLSGADDVNPSPAQADQIDAALTEAGVTHEMHLYPGAAHAFMSEGGASYREEAAKDGWQQCLKWLRAHL
ncbi:MAG: dienelactone hydrolase family protein [Dehalococcoidia bacterium]